MTHPASNAKDLYGPILTELERSTLEEFASKYVAHVDCYPIGDTIDVVIDVTYPTIEWTADHQLVFGQPSHLVLPYTYFRTDDDGSIVDALERAKLELMDGIKGDCAAFIREERNNR